MLSVQRKEQELNAEKNPKVLLPLAGLRVLTSIDDLQRAAQDITLEEIEKAEEKVTLMVGRLSSLQTVCANVDVIRQFVAKVEKARLHIPDVDTVAPEKEIPRQPRRNPDRMPQEVDSSSSDAPLVNAAINAPLHKAAGETLPLVNSAPPAPNPAWETDVNLTAPSHEVRPETQRGDFTLGDNELGEQRFELGVSPAQGGAETKISVLAEERYATLASTPEATPARTFSFHRDQEPTSPPAMPLVETLPVGFFDRMIANFTAFVGPMAALIVEEQVANLGEALSAFPRSRVEELTAQVSREILDDQAKFRFQRQMAEQVRTLASQAPAASQRKEK